MAGRLHDRAARCFPYADQHGDSLMSMRGTLLPHRRMYLAAFLLDFSVAVGLTAMPFFIVERLDGGAALSGTVGAVQMALYAAGCLASAGLVSRARSSLRWAVAGVSLFALLFTLAPRVRTSGLCIVAASAPFLGLALAWPAMQAWLGQERDPAVRARHLAGFNTATAFGFTLSPLLTGPLYDTDYRLPFAMLAVLCTGVLGLLLSLMPKATHSALPAPEEPSAGETGETSLTNGLLYASWAALFTANGLFAAVRSVYPVRVEMLSAEGSLTLIAGFRPSLLAIAGPATIYSWLAFLLSLFTVLCFAIMGWTRIWQGRYAILACGQLAAAVSFVVLGQTRSLAVMAVCFAVVGLNYGLCFFASLYYSLAHAEKRHRRAAINEGALGAGGFAGGIGVGYAAEALGITAAFQWTPVLIVPALLAQIFLLRCSRARDGAVPRTS